MDQSSVRSVINYFFSSKINFLLSFIFLNPRATGTCLKDRFFGRPVVKPIYLDKPKES